jgi:8-oxo-dGTP diphosphatase
MDNRFFNLDHCHFLNNRVWYAAMSKSTEQHESRHLAVTAAVVRRGDRFLIARRKSGSHLEGHWEFPGGKIEPGETPETCLAREIEEEFRVQAKIGKQVCEVVHAYPEKTIRLLAYATEINEEIREWLAHDHVLWATISEMDDIPMAPADLPIIEAIRIQQASLGKAEAVVPDQNTDSDSEHK